MLYPLVIIRKSAYKSWTFRGLPSPAVIMLVYDIELIAIALMSTHHFEAVQFFLDLLCEHWRKAVAGCNLTATVILPTWPCVIKDDPWAEGSRSLACGALRRRWSTLCVLTKSKSRHEIILIADRNRVSPLVALNFFIRGARSGGARRVRDVGDYREVESRTSGFGTSR